MEEGLRKVHQNEYPELKVDYRRDVCYVGKEIMAHCLALSQASKLKQHSFPKVKYIFFDEYMISEESGNRYVNGWKEPDNLLSIYHTIDREEDRVIVFLMGNNIQFYNPYHLHNAFNIPVIQPGEIWTSENVLYQWAVPSDELKAKKSTSKFVRMVEGTDYGSWANEGIYIGDNYNMIGSRTYDSQCICVIKIDNMIFGLWVAKNKSCVVISDKYNLSVPAKYGVLLSDVNESWPYFRTCGLFRTYRDMYRSGLVYFESMEIKMKCSALIDIFIRGV